MLIAAAVGKLSYSAYQRYREKIYHDVLQKTIKLSSPEIVQNGIIPKEFTGDGNDISPVIEWSNIPEGSMSYAVIMTDNDAPSPVFKLMTVDHWILFNIPVSINSLPENINMEEIDRTGISAGKNITGKREYIGPKPPFGKHMYKFRVYALSVPEISLSSPTRRELLKEMKGHILAYGELSAFYKKQ